MNRIDSQRLNVLLDLNVKFIDGYKKLMILLVELSNKNNIPLPQNSSYLISESNRLTQTIKKSNYPNQTGNWYEYKNFTKSNLLFLETMKELLNTLMDYSQKNDIQLPLELYYLLYEGDKLYQSLVSDEFLQEDSSDTDLTEPIKLIII
ncbi:MAG: hypothetical protein FIB08_00590 [Candidatus Methanoperedens sp.]|nr:hypothetical protein [Candidatus Methanoperedens sp.]